MHSSDKNITILAISGSLRTNSSNHAVIRAAKNYIPAHVNLRIYDGLGTLPHFNDANEPGLAVIALRNELKMADGVIICSPEYAFGVPGSLKNALDWTVSSGEFVNKPLALITAATGGNNAHAALQLIFKALSARLTPETSLLISFVRAKMNTEGEVSDIPTLNGIQNVISALLASIADSDNG